MKIEIEIDSDSLDMLLFKTLQREYDSLRYMTYDNNGDTKYYKKLVKSLKLVLDYYKVPK